VDDDDSTRSSARWNCTTNRTSTRQFHQLLLQPVETSAPATGVRPPEGLALTLADGQTVLLEHLYHHYLLEPRRMDDLIESHINLLDYCGDDVPDLKNYKQIKPLLFRRFFATASRNLPAAPRALVARPCHRRGHPGLGLHLRVNSERLKDWSRDSSKTSWKAYSTISTASRPSRRAACAMRKARRRRSVYVDHAFSASFILFEDFYNTTAHNLSTDDSSSACPTELRVVLPR